MRCGRREIAERLFRRVGRFYRKRPPSRFETKLALETILTLITRALLAGEKVKIRGFGTFEVRERAGRMVRDFKTGRKHKGRPYRTVVFRPSAGFTKTLDF